ncbi:MAG: hypothetical protein PHO18_00165 [Synergistaceae bacterium]|nr:hypothetical protein [Synergistaceae bacterium]
MKKTLIYTLTALLILLSANLAFAHPPKNVTLAWDKASDTLTITADHSVNDPVKHYILTLTVFEGNKQLLLKQYNRQRDASGFSDSVILKGMKPGSSVRVQLVCNIMGSTESEIKIH